MKVLVLRKIVGKTKIDRIRSQQVRISAVSNLSMSGWKEQGNGANMKEEWMLRDYLKYQGTIYLSEEDLQDGLKGDGAT